MAKNYMQNPTIGIFNEGLTLYIVKLFQAQKRVAIADAQIIKLPSLLEVPEIPSEIIIPTETPPSTEITSIDITAEPAEEILKAPTAEKVDETAILINIIGGFFSKRSRVAVAVSEPDIFYTTFSSDWGLHGKRLIKRVIIELAKLRGGEQKLGLENLSPIKLPNERLIVIVRDREIGILNLLDKIRKQIKTRMPTISFIESIEVSLVNLVKENYHFSKDEMNLIVYIGNEFSRLIFLQGNELFYISQLIGNGFDSPNIANILYSRMLFEQDNLNLSKVNNILLAGKVNSSGIKEFLLNTSYSEANIDNIKFETLDTSHLDTKTMEMLPEFSVPIGAAWRAIDIKNRRLLNVDLIPARIKEGQKVLKLGVIGWMLFLLIPVFVLIGTLKTAEYAHQLKLVKIQLAEKQSELIKLNELQASIDAAQNDLINYQSSFSVVDSITVGTKTWSEFLQNLLAQVDTLGDIWFTDIVSEGKDQVLLNGYSLYRNRISRLVKSMGEASLQSVDVQDIREKTVYRFSIKVKVIAK